MISSTKVVRTKKLLLTLNEAEADILLGMMQNPFHPEETNTEKTLREDLWKACNYLINLK